MGESTKIEWTDHSASPWYGCAHVHAGCDHCYAETMAKRNPSTLGIWGADGTRVKSKSFIANLRKWNREAEAAGKIVSVFPSLCDPFEDRPELVPWRQEMFATIDECQNVRLLLLTKRPENIFGMFPPSDGKLKKRNRPRYERGEIENLAFRDNVWLLASVSDQATADAMIPSLLKCRDLVPVLGLSVEPLLGPINLGSHAPGWLGSHACEIDWIIVGGESGPKSRPMHPAWARSLRDQCQDAGVPFFFKQWGEYRQTQYAALGCNQICMRADGHQQWCPSHPDYVTLDKVGKKSAGRLLDGREWSEFPHGKAVPA